MSRRKLTLGVSMKMYFGYQQTLDWCRKVGAIVSPHPLASMPQVRLFVLPAFPALAPVTRILADSPVDVGAQDLHWADNGAFTGEVSGAMLHEIGCRYVEIGHAERRRYFGETDELIALKTAAAWRNGLTPVLCVGEESRGPARQAIEICQAQLDAALDLARKQQLTGDLILAYEPQWAIGSIEPAPVDEISEVCQALKQKFNQQADVRDGRVIYGGSAGPGLLSQLGEPVDGLFLGRFAHDPAAFRSILDEALALHQ
ncbi:L-erythrulose-1-phosphate isomerase [Brenneria tiliae]|uniref:L-erythrulose-1-phosphate isomerase n=1 Tax=Brenneria tiliae TaxID=2914984 RepID=UPI0020149707|nr:triose-phosphate isomerase family protein [Brenneria tiliae]MCL2896304.1 triose-phosphate isomerase [Brenneria tiliae]MCL2900928.1 triose-phosphate isomerase [Brenneria tiliae]